MDKPRILVIDDEEIIRNLLSDILTKDYDVETVGDGNAALQKVKETFFNLLITDLKMPRLGGLDVLKEIKRVNPYIEVIIITGYPTIESAVEAIKIGAFDFICKPFDVQEMKLTIDRCLERQKFNKNHFELGELITLFEVGKTITANTDLDYLLGQILDSALRLVRAKRGSLMLRDEKTGELTVKATRGLNEGININVRTVSGEETAYRLQGDSEEAYEGKAFLQIPLVGKYLYPQKDVFGAIYVTDKIFGGNFTEREHSLLCILADEAATAIENYKLYSQLQDKVKALGHTIKELNETQNQLIQTEKMAAVGQLASGIAHEIRNPLGIVMGGVEFLKNRISDEDGDIKESIEKIKQSIDRANNIIIDLLKFSRASQLKLQEVDILRIMDETISLIKNQAYLNAVEINRNYGEKEIYVKADPNMLRQVFFNLCINAIDAMPKGGRLTLNMYTSLGSGQNEKEAVVEILDTGKGIPEDILPKIFNPFFTTKEPGKGTGLGLSIVHLIIERHNGRIGVESKVNEGTKFTLKLPAIGG